MAGPTRVIFYPFGKAAGGGIVFNSVVQAASYAGIKVDRVYMLLKAEKPTRDGQYFERIGASPSNAPKAILFWPVGREKFPPIIYETAGAAAAGLDVQKGVVLRLAAAIKANKKGTFAFADTGLTRVPEPGARLRRLKAAVQEETAAKAAEALRTVTHEEAVAALERERAIIERAEKKAAERAAAIRRLKDEQERAAALTTIDRLTDEPSAPALSLDGRLVVTLLRGTFRGVPCVIRRCRPASSEDVKSSR